MSKIKVTEDDVIVNIMHACMKLSKKKQNQ